jgi:hypothetical protein
MFIKQRNSETYDVFIGDGWDNHLSVTLAHSERKAVPVTAAPHLDATPKLLELIYFKIKKQQNEERNKKRNQALK